MSIHRRRAGSQALSRRRFLARSARHLAALGITGLLAAAPGAARWGPISSLAAGATRDGPRPASDPSPVVGRPSIRGLDGIAAVAIAYLAAYPDESTVETLARLLGVEGPERGLAGRLRRRVRTLEAAVRADHAGGDVAVLDGWWLSRTEARLAALVHLARIPPPA